MANTNVQPQQLYPHSVAVHVDGATGNITTGTKPRGIKQSTIARTGTGAYTLEVNCSQADAVANVQAFGTGGIANIATWAGTTITVNTLDFAGAAHDVNFQLTVDRIAIG
jgi:hypothetical protein